MSDKDIPLLPKKFSIQYMRERNLDKLPCSHPYSYENLMEHPKVMHYFRTRDGRCLVNLHTGGFLRLATLRGRAYWVAQNEHHHCTPDWKIHFALDDSTGNFAKAWNIVALLFLVEGCEVGMKVSYIPADKWKTQQGRELTLYMYTHHEPWGYGPMPEDKRYHLSAGLEKPESSWHKIISRAEQALSANGVVPRPTADGDLALRGMRYASLRNEAFVVDFDAHQKARCLMYPPNRRGWNAAGHASPLPVGARGWLSAQCAECRHRTCNFNFKKSAAFVVAALVVVVAVAMDKGLLL